MSRSAGQAASPRAAEAPHVLREYALVADGERGALVGPRGNVTWLCAPQWHDEPVFGELIGGAGHYMITPTGRCVWGGYYEPGSLVWRSRWVLEDWSVVECREALARPARPDTVVLLRQVRAVSGTAQVHVELDVRAGAGRHRMSRLQRSDDGAWSGRSGPLHWRWSGMPDARVEDGVLHGTLTIEETDSVDLVLEVGTAPLVQRAHPDRLWSETATSWSEDVPDMSATVAHRDAEHAYAVLRGLTSSSGGMVAAATTGLPERAKRHRSYDYRYVWIRDQCYAGLAAAAHGPLPAVDDAVRFVTARLLADGDRLKPAYRIDGGPVPDVRDLDLPGYPGGAAVVGNHVNSQFQLDTLGEILQLLAAAGRLDHLDEDGWRAARVAVDVVEKRWKAPDAGIWELEDDWWTQSRLAVVAGLRRMAEIVPGGGDAARAETLADGILAETSRRCLSAETGAWQRSPSVPGVDASLLLPPVRGALPPTDPRSRATLAAVRDQLMQDGYVYRFRPDATPLGEQEGAFLLCGFLLALAEHAEGNHVAAFRAFDRARASSGPPGLLAEEYDVRQRQLRGNLPQAFVHALLLECSSVLRPDTPPAGAAADRAPGRRG